MPKPLETILITNAVRSLVPGTTFAVSPQPYLDHEISVLKPALIYADKIRLRSYLIDLRSMAHWVNFSSRMPQQFVYACLSVARTWPPELMALYGINPAIAPSKSTAARYRKRAQMALKDDDSLEPLWRFEEKWRPFCIAVYNGFMGAAARFASECDLSDLNLAIEAGVLTVSGWSDEPPEFGEDEQQYVNRASWALQDELRLSEQTFLLDAGAMRSLRYPSADKELEITRRLLCSLPTFSRATVNELLDIRKELKSPLIRFRGAVRACNQIS